MTRTLAGWKQGSLRVARTIRGEFFLGVLAQRVVIMLANNVPIVSNIVLVGEYPKDTPERTTLGAGITTWLAGWKQ